MYQMFFLLKKSLKILHNPSTFYGFANLTFFLNICISQILKIKTLLKKIKLIRCADSTLLVT